MSKARLPYPAAFHQQIVELVQAGRSPADLSREFGVTAQSIINWVRRAAVDASKSLPGKDRLTADSGVADHLCRHTLTVSWMLRW